MSTSGVAIGALLREWRAARHLSQLDLALEASVSARHLSCVERGKAQPSREMVARLADALAMPLRERNALLLAAGYAPKYRESPLSTPEMAPILRAIESILEHHEPYPAFVMNQHWDLLFSNRTMKALAQWLRDGAPSHANLMRQIFDPNDMRPLFANWDDLASDLIRHLHSRVARAPSDTKARALLDEVLAYPGVPAEWRTRGLGVAPLPMLTSRLRKADLELCFFSTFTTFDTSSDVTIDELRIECMFPTNEATAAFCRSLTA